MQKESTIHLVLRLRPSTYTVTNSVTNTTMNGETSITNEDDYNAFLVADGEYKLPDMVYILVGGSKLNTTSYSYNKETGKLTIPASLITGNITIEGDAEEITYKVIFDAQGGTFQNGDNTLTFEKWTYENFDNLEEPTKEGYKFLGYFTEKVGGTAIDYIMAESGIDQNRTFYAQWEEKQEQKDIELMGNTDNQKFTKGEDEDLTFILNSNRSYGKVIVNENEVSEENYTWHFLEGTYPTITLSEDYMKTLGIGTYNIKFLIDNGTKAETTFIIIENTNVDDTDNKDNEDDSITKNDKNNNEVEDNKNNQITNNEIVDDEIVNNINNNVVINQTNNPETGDNVLVFIGLLFISMVVIIITSKAKRNIYI